MIMGISYKYILYSIAHFKWTRAVLGRCRRYVRETIELNDLEWGLRPISATQ